MSSSDIKMFKDVPPHLRGGLARYLLHGIQPGHFMQAFLNNDLMEAIGRADSESVKAFRQIAIFLYNSCNRNTGVWTLAHTDDPLFLKCLEESAENE